MTFIIKPHKKTMSKHILIYWCRVFYFRFMTEILQLNINSC